MSKNILLVEDDRDLASAVIGSLELEGIVCDYASNGLQGLDLALKNSYDVLLLDVSLPRLGGLDLCKRLRGEGADVPILMLTARDSLNDKIAGFAAGADDYLTKPFAMEELVARISALAKRRSLKARRVEVADLKMDLDAHRVWRGGKELSLTPTEWRLLEELAVQSPNVVAREHLEETVWEHSDRSKSLLKVYLSRLRKKLESEEQPQLLHTLPGVGVTLRAEEADVH